MTGASGATDGSAGATDAGGGGTAGSGVVLASYGRGVLVQTDVAMSATAPALRCSLRGRKQRIVCGDRITWSYRQANDGASVDSIEPRRNLIERIDLRGRAEPVAANIDRLAIVVATEPVPDWFLVDRYWAGARLKDIATLLIVNKSDLGVDGLRPELETYASLGLPCLQISSQSGSGIDGLRAALAGSVTLLVGQSGVGKSSIVNTLAPHAAAQTAELTRDAEGRHTTTTARRYRLGADAAIIDAPGVRDFAPPASLVRAAERGFVEIHEHSAACRFNDCRHMEEPGCAVRAAIASGAIAARRYESYRRLCRLYEKLTPSSR
ncbi:MAG: ribosome small subunit-dependent GTPase A [Pseudomonadota bacterium]|nr:ribosome small subunit-dependent GTPase A [Pseudomonadota bacterium]